MTDERARSQGAGVAHQETRSSLRTPTGLTSPPGPGTVADPVHTPVPGGAARGALLAVAGAQTASRAKPSGRNELYGRPTK